MGPIPRSTMNTVTAIIVNSASTASAATIQKAGERRPEGAGGRGGGSRGSSVVSVDHWVPSQWR